MSNLSIALAMILSIETPDMDCSAVGDLHLPPARRAFGRMQIRKPVIDDLNKWYPKLRFTRADSQNAKLDILMAERWLTHWCGKKASVRTYLSTWNGGYSGRRSKQALEYVKRAYRKMDCDDGHYQECLKVVSEALK